MTPETPVVIAPVAAPDAEAALEEAAASLDSLAEQLDVEGELSQEILTEVKECRSTVNQLSQLIPTLNQTESPSMQQALIQLTALQTTVEKIQAELEALRASRESTPEVEIVEALPSGNPDGPKGKSGVTPPLRPPGQQNSPESNQSVTPEMKRKRYVKI